MTGHGLRWGVMGKAMRAGMPADQDEVRGCLTVFAADEALRLVVFWLCVWREQVT